MIFRAPCHYTWGMGSRAFRRVGVGYGRDGGGRKGRVGAQLNRAWGVFRVWRDMVGYWGVCYWGEGLLGRRVSESSCYLPRYPHPVCSKSLMPHGGHAGSYFNDVPLSIILLFFPSLSLAEPHCLHSSAYTFSWGLTVFEVLFVCTCNMSIH